jgi:hypothetical protein
MTCALMMGIAAACSSSSTTSVGTAAKPNPCNLLTTKEIRAATGASGVNHTTLALPTDNHGDRSCGWALPLDEDGLVELSVATDATLVADRARPPATDTMSRLRAACGCGPTGPIPAKVTDITAPTSGATPVQLGQRAWIEHSARGAVLPTVLLTAVSGDTSVSVRNSTRTDI